MNYVLECSVCSKSEIVHLWGYNSILLEYYLPLEEVYLAFWRS